MDFIKRVLPDSKWHLCLVPLVKSPGKVQRRLNVAAGLLTRKRSRQRSGKIGTWVAFQGKSRAGKSPGGGQTRGGDTLKAILAGNHSCFWGGGVLGLL